MITNDDDDYDDDDGGGGGGGGDNDDFYNEQVECDADYADKDIHLEKKQL